MSRLVLFHGSNIDFDRVDLAESRDKRDFGRGFYMTTLREQAVRWAQNMYVRHSGPGRFVYEFELNIFPDLRMKRFDGLSAEWLDMVKRNRVNGGIQHDYDVICGPVANDDTMRTIALFVSGIYSEEIALKQLAFFKPNDQVSIHTVKALEYLRMVSKDNGE
ncbi:hypothetical protein FACS1894167_13710 [Synergistales bacterium]|nr:hypothetical protein FACS1894167_13710 [Synergistales bacterium]